MIEYDSRRQFDDRRKVSITEQGYTAGRLLDSTECQILLDTGASKSFMSKFHYLH